MGGLGSEVKVLAWAQAGGNLRAALSPLGPHDFLRLINPLRSRCSRLGKMPQAGRRAP